MQRIKRRRQLEVEVLERRYLLATVELVAVADNTLYESANGSESNGAGAHFFAGVNGLGTPLRGLVRFDLLDQVPTGATIDSVSLSLNMSRAPNTTSRTIALHRVLADWGEGGSNATRGEGGGAPSQANDATWIHRKFDSELWTNAGGDFVSTASATRGVGSTGPYAWTSDGMRADVQQWLNDPTSNFGWLLQGDESTSRTVKRFDTHENATAANRPKLTVTFTPSDNEAPTDLTLSASSIAENTSTQSDVLLGTLSAADPDANDTHVFDFATGVGSTDNGKFRIVDDRLEVRAGTILDHETDPQFQIRLKATDGGGLSFEKAFTIDVTDVNEAPTVSLTARVNGLAEDTNTAQAIRIADIEVADDALGDESLSLTGPDSDHFEINNGRLFLKANTTLDFETKDRFQVTVAVDDLTIPGTPDSSDAHTLSVLDVNEPPEVSLGRVILQLPEDTDTASAVRVADVQVTDDALGTEVISLVGDDAGAFEVVNGELRLRANTQLDFEMQATYSVTVQVDDSTIGLTPDDSEPYTLQVTDVDEPPTVALTVLVASLFENSDTSTAVTVAEIVVTDDAQGTSQLTLAGQDASHFQIADDRLQLRPDTPLDFEMKSSFLVRVEVDDATLGGTPDDVAEFTLDVLDVNEPPTLTLSDLVSELPEDADVTVARRVATINVQDDALGDPSLTLTGVDAQLFELVSDQLRLRANVVLDFETKPALDVVVEIDDDQVGSSPDDQADFHLDVLDANDPPAVSLTNLVDTLPENSNNSQSRRVADIVVADDALGDETLAVAGADADRFEIVDLALRLKADVVLDFELQSRFDVSVTVDDPTVGNSPDGVATYSLQLSNVNEAPTDLSLSNTTIAENIDTTTPAFVASLTVEDVDDNDQHRFSLVAGDGDDDNGLFQIADADLELRAGASVEGRSELTVRIGVADASDLAIEKAFVLQISGSNQPPNEIQLDSSSVAENSNLDQDILVGILTAVDPDQPGGHSFFFVQGPGSDDNSLFVINQDRLEVPVSTILNHEVTPSFQVRIAARDSGDLEFEATFTIQVTDVNEGPSATGQLEDQLILDGELFEFAIPSGRFTDVDAEDQLTFSATLADGGAVPSWLAISPSDGTLSGTASPEDAGFLNVIVQVADQGGLTADLPISLTVLRAAAPWQNPAQPRDINRDGELSPVGDILTLINDINQRRVSSSNGSLPAIAAGQAPPPFYDFNGDGLLTPVGDVLPQINFFNQGASEQEGGPPLFSAVSANREESPRSSRIILATDGTEIAEVSHHVGAKAVRESFADPDDDRRNALCKASLLESLMGFVSSWFNKRC